MSEYIDIGRAKQRELNSYSSSMRQFYSKYSIIYTHAYANARAHIHTHPHKNTKQTQTYTDTHKYLHIYINR